MLLKAFQIGAIGLVFTSLGFIAPSGWSVSQASATKVQKAPATPGRTGSSSSSSRRGGYVFVGGYHGGK